MPHYDYCCEECGYDTEIFHMMSDSSSRLCPECESVMIKQMGTGYLASSGFKPTSEDRKESEYTKKVRDKERSVKSRRKAFGHDAVGDPVDTPDSMHIIKKGKTLGGQQMEVDKKEFIKAAAKDPLMVHKAQEILKKSND